MKEAKKRYARYLNRRYADRSTPYHYLRDLELFMRQVGNKEPREITGADIDEFVDGQVERGLKASTINRRVAALHTFFEYLASEVPDENWPNPVNRRRHCLKRGDQLPRDALDVEVAALFEVIDDARDLAMFGLMVGAGLRVGEVAELGCSSLGASDEATGAVQLRVMGKGRKERTVWLTPYWADVIYRWRQQRPEVEDDRLFVNQHGTGISVAGIQYRLRQYCDRAGITLTCHQLRHTFARRLAEERMPTESIAQLLGHRQLATTQRYTAGANPELRDAFLDGMARIDPVVGQPQQMESMPAAPKRQSEEADMLALERASARLDSLPEWLRTMLTNYLRHRWRDWQPHRAPANADRLSRQLLQIWTWFLDAFRPTGWDSLQRSQVEQWLDSLRMRGLAVNTQRSLLSTFFGCLHFALEHDCSLSPNLFRVPYPKRTDALPRFIPQEDYSRLIETVLAQPAEDSFAHLLNRTWFLTLLLTGIRTCELLDLRLSDVDIHGRRLWIHTSKNQHPRVVYITPALATALTAYLARRPQTNDDHLWIRNDLPLDATRVRYCFQRWSAKLGISVSAHRLRHTLATQLINQGMSMSAIATLLGHRSLNTTQQYARLFDQTVQDQFLDAMTRIERIPALDWPISSTSEKSAVEQTFDSM